MHSYLLGHCCFLSMGWWKWELWRLKYRKSIWELSVWHSWKIWLGLVVIRVDRVLCIHHNNYKIAISSRWYHRSRSCHHCNNSKQGMIYTCNSQQQQLQFGINSSRLLHIRLYPNNNNRCRSISKILRELILELREDNQQILHSIQEELLSNHLPSNLTAPTFERELYLNKTIFKPQI